MGKNRFGQAGASSCSRNNFHQAVGQCTRDRSHIAKANQYSDGPSDKAVGGVLDVNPITVSIGLFGAQPTCEIDTEAKRNAMDDNRLDDANDPETCRCDAVVLPRRHCDNAERNPKRHEDKGCSRGRDATCRDGTLGNGGKTGFVSAVVALHEPRGSTNDDLIREMHCIRQKKGA